MLKVFLAGDGAPDKLGVLEALLRRIRPDGWRVAGAQSWRSIRKYRAGAARDAPDHGEARNTRGLVLRAYEARCDLLIFVHDVDPTEGFAPQTAPSGSAAGRGQAPAGDQTALPSGSAAGRGQAPAVEDAHRERAPARAGEDTAENPFEDPAEDPAEAPAEAPLDAPPALGLAAHHGYELAIVRGVARPTLEGWILCLLGVAGTDEMSTAHAERALAAAASTAAYRELAETRDLPSHDCSLSRWLIDADAEFRRLIDGVVTL